MLKCLYAFFPPGTVLCARDTRLWRPDLVADGRVLGPAVSPDLPRIGQRDVVHGVRERGRIAGQEAEPHRTEQTGARRERAANDVPDLRARRGAAGPDGAAPAGTRTGYHRPEHGLLRQGYRGARRR